MRNATRPAASALLLALAACGATEREQQPDEDVADIDVLPADESSATSSGELANGAQDRDLNELGNQH